MTRESRRTRGHRAPKKAVESASPSTPPTTGTKLDRLAALLARRNGASIAEMMSATGWQPHSVRGALAGSLKRRGLVITSEKVDGVRRYRSGTAK